MYTAQITKERIKFMCKNKKINMEQVLTECSLGVNAIRQINDAKGMASFSLAKIADYLDCSVDYLLGRTDNPSINGNNINNVDTTINGTQANIIQNNNTDLDEIKTILSGLSNSKRHRAIADMLDLLEEYIEK